MAKAKVVLKYPTSSINFCSAQSVYPTENIDKGVVFNSTDERQACVGVCFSQVKMTAFVIYSVFSLPFKRYP